MTDAIRTTIEEMTKVLDQKLREVAELKRTINTLARQLGEDPVYQDAEPEAPKPGRRGLSLRPDEFYGKSPIVAAREYLEKRVEPCTAEEILEALTRGGFDFNAQGWKDEKNRLRNLAISLGKNTAIFTRLPSGYFGLAKWYPGAKRPPRGGKPEEGQREETAQSQEGQEGTTQET